MADKNYEIIIRYNSWHISIFDNANNLLTELKCKPIWFTGNYSGSSNINGSLFSLNPDKNGISLREDNMKIGEVKITPEGTFGYIANIEINENLYTLRRENLKERFTIVNEYTHITIEGMLYKEKQKNLIGLVYCDDNLYYSVFISDELTNKSTTLQILAICGYCIRLFQSLHMGE